MSAIHQRGRGRSAGYRAGGVGEAEIPVPPSELTIPNAWPAANWIRGIPAPGVANFIPATTGTNVSTCASLLASSPPTLLERYGVKTFAIGWSLAYSASAPSTASIELAFLVNDRVRFVAQQSAGLILTAISGFYLASGAFVGDLINPLLLDARDRLSLRIGAVFSGAPNAQSQIIVGTQLAVVSATQIISPYESIIRYAVVPVPGSRALP